MKICLLNIDKCSNEFVDQKYIYIVLKSVYCQATVDSVKTPGGLDGMFSRCSARSLFKSKLKEDCMGDIVCELNPSKTNIVLPESK